METYVSPRYGPARWLSGGGEAPGEPKAGPAGTVMPRPHSLTRLLIVLDPLHNMRQLLLWVCDAVFRPAIIRAKNKKSARFLPCHFGNMCRRREGEDRPSGRHFEVGVGSRGLQPPFFQ